MVQKTILACMLAALVVFGPSGLLQADDSTTESSTKTSAPRPRAVFPEMKYQFEPVLEGERVKHTYKVVNKGEGDLKIDKVKTG